MDDINIVVRALPELVPVLMSWAALALLYIIIRKFLHGPITKFLQDRKDRVQSDIEGAKVLQEEAEKLREDYQSRIELAKKESQEIVEGARKRGEEIKEDIISQARKEAEGIISRARKDSIRERETAMQDIKSQAGEMAILIASKIMEEEVKMDKQKGLIDKFIDEVGSSQWQS